MLRNFFLVVLLTGSTSFVFCQRVLLNSSSVLESDIPCNTPLTGETYDACWIYPDGSFKKVSPAGSFDRDHVAEISPVTTFQYGTCYSVDKYGDDADMAILISGGNATGISGNPNFYSAAQAPIPAGDLGGTEKVKIQSVFSGNFVVPQETIMLIITVGNDTSNNANYRVRLDYDTHHLTYIAPSSFPSAADSYASFAPTPGSQGGTLVWDLGQVGFTGMERNIYVLFKVKSQVSSSTPTVSFLSQTSKSVPYSELANAHIQLVNGAYFDPNQMTVVKIDTTICGNKDEVFEYTIHFQNEGSINVNTIQISSQIDTSLDLSSMQVVRACVGMTRDGSCFIEDRNGIHAGLTRDRQFSWWVTEGREDIRGFAPSVPRNVFFLFSNVGLTGVAMSTDDDDLSSMGYVTFRIKSKTNYDSLHCMGGIVFGSLAEVVTNDCVFKCQSPPCTDCTSSKWWIIVIILILIIIIIIIIVMRRRRRS